MSTCDANNSGYSEYALYRVTDVIEHGGTAIMIGYPRDRYYVAEVGRITGNLQRWRKKHAAK